MLTDGTLTFRTRLDVNTNTPGINRVVQFQLRDNGADSPSPNTNLSVIRAFTLNVNAVNDPPIPAPVKLNGTEDVTLELPQAISTTSMISWSQLPRAQPMRSMPDSGCE